jgi:hypothetical protein
VQKLAIKEKLHTYIDSLPEENLLALEPLLSFMAEDYWKPVIETDLTVEEKAIIKEGEKHYKEHPEDFVPLESLFDRS